MSSRLLPVECNFTEVFTSLNQIPVFYVSFPLSSFFTYPNGFHVDGTQNWELSDQKLQIERLWIQDHGSNVLLL